MTHPSRQSSVYALITRVTLSSMQEPFHFLSLANWAPLNNTGQRLLSQWVVIDFTSWFEAHAPSFSWPCCLLLSTGFNCPLEIRAITANCAHVHSPQWGSGMFNIYCQPSRAIIHSSRHFLSSHRSLHAHTVFPCCQLLWNSHVP